MPRIEYWLQIENQPWDVCPNGIDRATGENFSRDATGLFKPLANEALIIRRYTANWAAPDDRALNAWDLNEWNPSQTRGTIPGATIEAKVGDEIIVHFRNNDQRANVSDAERIHSLHAHGVQHKVVHDGIFPFAPADSSQNNSRGDRLKPGESFDYYYSVIHLSNAGVWAYCDGAMFAQQSIALGACGAIVVRAGGESRAQLPAQSLRASSDTPTRFADVPQPPPSVEHLLVIHDLAGIGECLNGRQGIGNTPTFLARVNTRVKFRVLNLTTRAQTFHLHGHRWRRGDDWTDAETIPADGGFSFEILEGSAENGGGNGEWAITFPSAPNVRASLVVTEGGALEL